MDKYPFLEAPKWVVVIRIVIGLMMAAHGAFRVYEGTVNEFGQFLDGNGFPLAVYLAWLITAFEIIGGIVLSSGFARKFIATCFIFELLMGIILVHASKGWFVVGASTEGMEFSVLLITCLLMIASTAKKQPE
jgi:putative oxidoreductase